MLSRSISPNILSETDRPPEGPCNGKRLVYIIIGEIDSTTFVLLCVHCFEVT